MCYKEAMDNGPNEIQRLTRRQQEEKALRKKNREREEKEAKTPIVPRAKNGKKRTKKYKQRIIKRDYPEMPEYKPGMKSGFYETREWRSVRWDVLIKSDGKCKICGRSKKDGIVLHVDHIKPRSRFPALELDKTNLQVLCEDCNIGKGAKT